MKRAWWLLLVLTAIRAQALAAEPVIQLKPGPGRAETASTCNGCHSLDYIVMNSVFLTPDGWKSEVAKMRQAYGTPMDDALAEKIVRYLSATYAAPPSRS